MMKNRSLALKIIIATLLVGCNGKQQKNVQGESQATDEKPIVYNTIYENPAYIEVYNEYVTYLNDITSSYDTAYDYYFKAFPEAYPDKIKGAPSLVTISDYPDDHLERALGSDLNIEKLEKPALKIKESILVLRKLMNEADGYYERQEYLDDGSVRGKALHDSIVPGFNKLNGAVDEFRNQIISIEEEMQGVELERYKKEGLMIRYYCLKILTIAREVNQFTQVETMDDYAALDVKNVIAVRKQLSENIKNLEKLATEEQFAKEFGTLGGTSNGKSSYEFGFKSASNKLVVHLRKLEERLNTNDFEPKIPNRTSSGIKDMMIKQFYRGNGLPESMSKTVGDLVDAYNDIID